MAKFVANLGIGFAGAVRDIPFEIDDEDLEGLSDDAREELIWLQAVDVIQSSGYIEIWFEESN